MAKQKTKPTEVSVDDFLSKVPEEAVRDDCYAIIKMMKKVTGSNPKMWGPSIVGFGKYHYKYESGHEGDSCLAAFSPRKDNLVVYAMPSEFPEMLKKLGKHKATKGCLYIKKLADIDMKVLESLVTKSMNSVKEKYG